MSLPRLTHLQFITLGLVSRGTNCGRDLRDALKRAGVRLSGPAFYQMMSRLEDGGLVRGWYDQHVVDGQIIRKRCYELSAAGNRAWRHCRDFYARWADDRPLPA